ncbi:hypothetical protein Ssi02_17470 [Sinosporangium siamense]|uniref:Uncharacterized protein n=1 Tax=Sinosporangium siamense TaxID=1367973 RepID=A0A919V620_9ACTN|nr:hypothetical protein Ssi02_17470 [Sinosporangium siamense]
MDFRRYISRQLNKGASTHALRRDLRYTCQGALVRARSQEQAGEASQEQAEEAWCLTILTNAPGRTRECLMFPPDGARASAKRW